MTGRRLMRGMAAATVPLALAVQSVLAIGAVPPGEATPAAPERPERRTSIDPGFIARAGADVDPGFIVRWDDTSNDTGFIVVGRDAISPPPSPSPTPPESPVVTLGMP